MSTGLSEKQNQILGFIHTDYTALICDGAIRSGKTSIMSFVFIVWAMWKFDRHSFAVCGKTVQSAYRNVITPLLGVRYFQKHGYAMQWAWSKHCLIVTRGGKTNYFYVFGGKDESSAALIQGMTLAGVLLDEVALMPRSFVEQALARCSVEKSRFWFNCNPESPNHWFYNEWIKKREEKNVMYLHFEMEDNPSLSPDILKRYQSLYSGIFYDRYIKGLWVLAEGLIYPMFSEKEHVVKEVPESGRYFISIDYGTLNPCSMGLWCLNGKQAVRIAEYYHSGRDTQKQLTDEEYYQVLEALAGDRYIEQVVIDPSAASFIACIRKHRKFRVRHAKNEVINGIRVTTGMLRNKSILFHESCKNTIKEFGLYRWDDRAAEDKVIKENDHAMDDIRYFCNTILKDKLNPRENYSR